MPHIRITSPTSAAAFALVDLLAEYGATAGPIRSGGWEIVVPLDEAERGQVPGALAATREWLDFCGFSSTSVTLDGHTHLLRDSRSSLPTVH
jgi:hypothetical protein